MLTGSSNSVSYYINDKGNTYSGVHRLYKEGEADSTKLSVNTKLY